MNKLFINEDVDKRLDVYLAQEIPEYSRNYFAGLIKEGQVLVNNCVVKPTYHPKKGDTINITFKDKEELSICPENIPLKIIYEDGDVIVIDKQPGLVVHPAAGTKKGTLVNALVAHFPKITEAVFDNSCEVSVVRPGLVHRLDKDTSGVIIIAKNPRAMHSLARQIQNRTVKKEYLALCAGWPKKDQGELVNYLGRNAKNRKVIDEVGEERGKIAISDYHVKKYFETREGERASLIRFDIKTGRTHQIRSQSKIFGHPVIGDEVYFNKASKCLSNLLKAKRQLLHSHSLTITLPGEHKPRNFIAPLPSDIQEVIGKMISK